MAKPTVIATVREPLRDAIDNLAAREGVSRSEMLSDLLEAQVAHRLGYRPTEGNVGAPKGKDKAAVDG